jgi:tRNA dimethylallyltransferase
MRADLSRPGWTPLFFLTGPTASGKTGLAHRIAGQTGWRILSADSMMVYRGMDIGTAKPSPEERRRHDYLGLDLVDPGQLFSTGAWLRAVRERMDDRPLIVTGGTGLYFRALSGGLAPEPPQTMEEGRGLERMSVPELQEHLRSLGADALECLADPGNPRRLIRAIQWLEAGRQPPSHWQPARESVPVPVLNLPVPDLDAGIHRRAGQMFEAGLLQEAETLRARHGGALGTASQAIGYAEAFQVLDEYMSPAEAVDAVALRTRRYAKRQRTWFRNQMRAIWIDPRDPHAMNHVMRCWQEHGPVWFSREDA